MRGRASDPESNARRFEETAAATREVVRVFPGYADTVIWYQGPVPYAETGLSSRLIAEMEQWESRYYKSIGRSHELMSAHLARGLELARALSEEIGDILPVETDEAGGGTTRLLTPGPGTNPEARNFFTGMLADAEAEDARIAVDLRSGAQFEWRPYRPE